MSDGKDAEPSSRFSGWLRGRARVSLWPLLGLSMFVIAWELWARLAFNSDLIVAPFSGAIAALWELITTGELWMHLTISAQEFVLGYSAAALVGLILGAAFASSNVLHRTFSFLILSAYATPIIAITPLLIVIFGLGAASKVAIVFLLAIFPIIINTESGLRSVDPDFIDTARAFRANRVQILRSVVFPAAIPSVVTGLRLAVGRGIVGVVVGEIFGARAGIGFLIVQSSQVFRTARTLGLVILLAVIGVGLNWVIESIERRISPWRQGIDSP